MLNARQSVSLYADGGARSEVASADPHKLVQLLFDELLTTLGRLEQAFAPQLVVRRNELASRGLSLLYALTASLDQDRGGRIAEDLAAIYEYSARRVQAGVRSGDRSAVSEATALIAEIAGAWQVIGK